MQRCGSYLQDISIFAQMRARINHENQSPQELDICGVYDQSPIFAESYDSRRKYKTLEGVFVYLA